MVRTHRAAHLREHVEDLRERKDAFFKEDGRSPVPEADRASFAGLSYFEYEEAWRVEARFERIRDGGEIRFPDITGQGPAGTYQRYAKATFGTPDGTQESVTLFAQEHHHHDHAPHEPHQLFLPLRDATSGKETYGAGRYLEVDNPLADGKRKGKGVIDLNLLYNPYCAYSEQFVCPMPPPENHLESSVRAGERTYKTD